MSVRFEVVEGRFSGWDVRKVTTSTRNGRVYQHFKHLTKRGTKEEAEAVAHSMLQGALGPLRRYILGKRMNRNG